jgi:hypothetical protein
MVTSSLSLATNYWDGFKIENADIEFIYNHLLELETPQTLKEILQAVVCDRINREKITLEKDQASKGGIYAPKETYHTGDVLTFPAVNWQTGTVLSVRAGHNPDVSAPFEVMEVEFESGEKHQFAARMDDHILNQPIMVKTDDPSLNPDNVLKTYGNKLAAILSKALEDNPDLVRIAGRWFPRALLVDVNVGHLNLAEAVLDMEGGGPMTTRAILEQIDLPTDSNIKLTEFSLNLALQEDGRFDEVGPSGEILWFLRRLEPEQVQSVPVFHKYNPISINQEAIAPYLHEFGSEVIDELEIEKIEDDEEVSEVTLSLIYPHWRAGTLPLSKKMSSFFPTAYESPRVQFSFIDGNTGDKFSGWVVRSQRVVFGLREWYETNHLMPGSLVHVKAGHNPGEVIIKCESHRPNRDWVRSALVGADGGIVFAMLKQMVYSPYDERMAVSLPDTNALDNYWQSSNRQRNSLEQTCMTMMRELSKLNPQGHVHGLELYAAVNLIKRCPPSAVLSILVEKTWANHLGDLYFKFAENPQEA